jgi:L-amino acid N-acyltransferase YncA
MKPTGFPKNITLKNGDTATIRLQEVHDAEALLAFYRSLPEEDRIFLDDDCTTRAWVDRFIRRSDFDKIIPLVAEAGGKILGHAWLIRTHYGWMAHVGQLRLAIARSCQRHGLGSAMVRELIRIANELGLEKMTVRMMDNQHGAIRAFERIGFRKNAEFPGLIKDVLGRKRNLVIMANDISQIWNAMETLVADIPPRAGY